MASKKRDGLYKRGRLWWISNDPITGRPESTKCTDLEAARRLLAGRERLAADSTHAAAHTARLVDWIDSMLEVRRRKVQRGKRSANTVSYYEKKLGHFVRIFGEDCVLASITNPEVDRYIAQRRDETATEHTISKEVAALQIVLRLAKRAGCYALDVDTLRPDDLTPEYTPVDRALPLNEVEALLAELSPERGAYVRVSVGLGVRLGEALRLTPENVDPDGYVEIPGTKTAAAKRLVPVLSIFRQMVADARAHLPLKPWGNLYRDMAAACARANIARCTPNDLRRSHQTILEEAGVDETVRMRLMGHTTPTMNRKVYGRPRAEALRELAERAIERSQIVVMATGREHCSAADSHSKCAESHASGNESDPQNGFLIHWSPVRIGAGAPENPIGRGPLRPICSARAGLSRLALGYAARAAGVLA